MSTFYRFPNGLHKALTLSYDDGVEQDVRLMEILDKHGIRCTFNLNSGCFAPEGVTYPAGTIHRRMSKSQVARVYANPRHEVAAHCLTHASLTELSPAEIAHEVLADRENLEAMFGGIVISATSPVGFTDALYEAVSALGTVAWLIPSALTPLTWRRPSRPPAQPMPEPWSAPMISASPPTG